jgi:hypothetical protein
MQYLDKKTNKSKLMRLLGYALGLIIITAGTITMVYAAKGWGIDTSSKQLVLNGIVNLEVKPSEAVKMSLDADETKTVDNFNRFSMTAGSHRLSLASPGMTPWQKIFNVSGGQVGSLPNARLYPLRPYTQTYEGFDKFTSVWPNFDNSKFYIKTPGLSLLDVKFSVYDPKLSYTSPSSTVPPVVETVKLKLSDVGVLGIFEGLKIAPDKNHYLVKQKTESFNFYRGDMSKPDVKTEELTKYFGMKLTEVLPLDDKSELMAGLDDAKNLRLLDFNAKTTSAPIAANVTSISRQDDLVITRQQLLDTDPASQRTVIYNLKLTDSLRLAGVKQEEFTPQTTPLVGPEATDCVYKKGSESTAMVCRALNIAYIYKDLSLKPNSTNTLVGATEQFALSDPTVELTKLDISPSGRNVVLIGATGLIRTINLNQKLSTTAQLRNYTGNIPLHWLDDDNVVYRTPVDGHLTASDLDGQNYHDFTEFVTPNNFVATAPTDAKAFAFLSANPADDKLMKLVIADITKANLTEK